MEHNDEQRPIYDGFNKYSQDRVLREKELEALNRYKRLAARYEAQKYDDDLDDLKTAEREAEERYRAAKAEKPTPIVHHLGESDIYLKRAHPDMTKKERRERLAKIKEQQRIEDEERKRIIAQIDEELHPDLRAKPVNVRTEQHRKRIKTLHEIGWDEKRIAKLYFVEAKVIKSVIKSITKQNKPKQ